MLSAEWISEVNKASNIKNLSNLVFAKISTILNLEIFKETFITLAKLASYDVIFNSHDGFYKDIDGLVMESAPASHLANGWLNSFDDIIKDASALFHRYIYDIECIIKRSGGCKTAWDQ